MEIALIVVALVALAAVLVLFRVIRQRDEASRQRDEAIRQRDDVGQQREEAAHELAVLKASHAARLEAIAEARESLDTHFKGIASEIVSANSASFLQQAKARFDDQRQIGNQDLERRQQAIDELIKPIRENLARFEKKVNEIEEKREGAYSGLTTQIGQLEGLTRNLGEALRSPQIRGLWGEQQLRTILELSGMQQHVNYHEQHSIETGDGTIRPDVVVQVPGGVQVVVDAKTSFQSFIDAHNTTDDEQRRQDLLKGHARALLGHAKSLNDKDYSASLDGSPDFVVMFVPADPILDAAMDVQPTLWQEAWEKHQVLIATPGLLLAFLKTVALAWKEQSLQENARQIADSSKELYDRLRIYLDHVAKMGRGLEQAVNSYNAGIGSLDGRVLPQARRLEELGPAATAKKIGAPLPVERVVRHLAAPELANAVSEHEDAADR